MPHTYETAARKPNGEFRGRERTKKRINEFSIFLFGGFRIKWQWGGAHLQRFLRRAERVPMGGGTAVWESSRQLRWDFSLLASRSVSRLSLLYAASLALCPIIFLPLLFSGWDSNWIHKIEPTRPRSSSLPLSLSPSACSCFHSVWTERGRLDDKAGRGRRKKHNTWQRGMYACAHGRDFKAEQSG